MITREKILAAILTAGIAVSSFGTVLSADETQPSDPAVTTESSAETKDLSAYSFENVYGSQLYGYLEHQYTFEGEQIPLAESNFYFINAFFELTNYAYYGMYPKTAEGYIDLASEYTDPTKYATYGDFLISYAERTLESSKIIAKRAADENLVLSDETLGEIDNMMSNLASEAQSANMTLDQYLQLYYGPSCNEAAYREVLRNYYLSDLYTSKYCEDHTTDEMRYVPNIRYALFYAPEDSSDEAALQSAESLANDLVTAANGDLDAFQTLAQQSVADEYCMESNDIAVSRGQTVSAFEAWAFDESREFGDIEVIYAPEYGYFAVGYMGITMQDSQVIDNQVVQELTKEISAAIESGQYQFGTTQEYAPAPTVAPEGSEPLPTTPEGTVPGQGDDGKSNVASVLIIIFAIIGGVAVVAIIIILTVYIVKKINGKGNAGNPDNGGEDEEEDRKEDKEDKSEEDKAVEDAIEEAEGSDEEDPEEDGDEEEE